MLLVLKTPLTADAGLQDPKWAGLTETYPVHPVNCSIVDL